MRNLTVMALLALFVGAVVLILANKAKPGRFAAIKRSLADRVSMGDLDLDSEID